MGILFQFIYLFLLFIFPTRLCAPSGKGQLPYCLKFRFSEILGQLSELSEQKTYVRIFISASTMEVTAAPTILGVKGAWHTPSAQTTADEVLCHFPLLLAHQSSKNAGPYVSRAS